MYGFYFIPLLLIGLTPLAFGEIEEGKNFNRELIQTFPDGVKEYLWTSHPDRIFDGEYKNYLFSETDDYLRFESQRITFEFYKDSCDFKLYDIGKVNGDPVISSYSTTIAVNDIVINFPVCLVQNITQDENGVDFKILRGAATIFYELNYASGVEWTYEVVGNGVITITEVCTDCVGEQIDEQRIKFGGYLYDTKNDIHGAFSEATQQGNDYWVKYESDSDGLLIIDPFFGYTQGVVNTARTIASTGASCPALDDVTTDRIQVRVPDQTNDRCQRFAGEFDITSIPDSTTVTSVKVRYSIDAFTATSDTVNWVSYSGDPSTDSVTTMWNAIGAGSLYATDTDFTASSGTKTIDLGSAGVTGLEANLADDQFEVGGMMSTEVRDGSNRDGVDFTTPTFELQVSYFGVSPDRVDDLTSTDIGFNTVDLSWTEPELNTGNLTGYQINYTTPWSSSVNTVITNNTENDDTTSEVTGLSELTPYSFRIGVWTEGFNGTGNVLNITTLEDFVSANFTPGFFDLNATNPDVIQMYFERTDTNSTSLVLNIVYPTAYDLSCDFSYEFANINQTYSGLSRSGTTHSGIDSAVESSFQFNNVDNEIIDVYCWDENNSSNDGYYIITQTMFPLLQQIADFRSGEFGTMGGFGAMDLITMFVIIISMIGFNRVNESVGAIFNIILLGSLAYFEIIELPTIIFGMIAVVIMVVIGTTRKK